MVMVVDCPTEMSPTPKGKAVAVATALRAEAVANTPFAAVVPVFVILKTATYCVLDAFRLKDCRVVLNCAPVVATGIVLPRDDPARTIFPAGHACVRTSGTPSTLQ